MAKIEMKKSVEIMVLFMLVFAQADDSLPPSSSKSAIGYFFCRAECDLKCAPLPTLLRKACLFGCNATCHKLTSKAAYECAHSCALAKSFNVKGSHTLTLILFIKYFYEAKFLDCY